MTMQTMEAYAIVGALLFACIVAYVVVLYQQYRQARSDLDDRLHVHEGVAMPTWAHEGMIGLDDDRQIPRVDAVYADTNVVAEMAIVASENGLHASVSYNWHPTKVASDVATDSVDDDPVMATVAHCTIVECHELAHIWGYGDGELDHESNLHSVVWDTFLIEEVVEPTLETDHLVFRTCNL